MREPFARHVRVRKKGGYTRLRPDRRFLGKEGTILDKTGIRLEDSPLTFYYVEFDSEEVEPISPDWLEPTMLRRARRWPTSKTC